jgi:hypothetical protein
MRAVVVAVATLTHLTEQVAQELATAVLLVETEQPIEVAVVAVVEVTQTQTAVVVDLV